VLTEAREYLDTLELETEDQNPKGRLQEILQAISPQSPQYPIVHSSGPELQNISREDSVVRIELGFGEGNSKKEAEVAAAQCALRQHFGRLARPNNRRIMRQQVLGTSAITFRPRCISAPSHRSFQDYCALFARRWNIAVRGEDGKQRTCSHD
jgi:hypothetical protein